MGSLFVMSRCESAVSVTSKRQLCNPAASCSKPLLIRRTINPDFHITICYNNIPPWKAIPLPLLAEQKATPLLSAVSSVFRSIRYAARLDHSRRKYRRSTGSMTEMSDKQIQDVGKQNEARLKKILFAS
jgi:uncharacterized protein YjiS (DUF1127 family)